MSGSHSQQYQSWCPNLLSRVPLAIDGVDSFSRNSTDVPVHIASMGSTQGLLFGLLYLYLPTSIRQWCHLQRETYPVVASFMGFHWTIHAPYHSLSAGAIERLHGFLEKRQCKISGQPMLGSQCSTHLRKQVCSLNVAFPRLFRPFK